MGVSPSVSMAQLGWDRRSGAPPRLSAASRISRVAVCHRGAYELIDPAGQTTAALGAAFRDAASSPLDYPTVGDWVVRSAEPRHDRRVEISAVLERSSLLCRRAPGPRNRPQLVVANADVLAVVTTPGGAELDGAISRGTGSRSVSSRGTRNRDGMHRVEWYLAAAYSGGLRPVIVVNKIDTVSDAECNATVAALGRRLGATAADVPVLTTSAHDRRGLDSLGALVAGGATVALSGASGVGKSSLVNCLASADVVEVASLSPDGRGRHTTVRRELVPVGGAGGDPENESGGESGSGTLVDTPGLQDLIPWGGDLGIPADGGIGLAVQSVFGEIAELADQCRFSDCAHAVEPDCAVGAAVQAGRLAPERLARYRQLLQDIGPISNDP